ncbi:hypothetical protein TNCV_452181 [Trichonephila clavipes]|nr:hypothetical protein TNCV_452181 [Trichonephila clavipes]
MVWGCMPSHDVGRLHIVGGTVKAMDYIEILQNKLLPTAKDLLGNQSWIFQDDNAPCHRAKEEFSPLDEDHMSTIPIIADKDILEVVQSSKNIIDADSDEENKKNNAAPVSYVLRIEGHHIKYKQLFRRTLQW